MLGLDEMQLTRLLERHDGTPLTTEIREFQKAIEDCFTFNRLKGERPSDCRTAVIQAIGKLQKEPARGACTIVWQGGPPNLGQPLCTYTHIYAHICTYMHIYARDARVLSPMCATVCRTVFDKLKPIIEKWACYDPHTSKMALDVDRREIRLEQLTE